jgi:hypothetical protein
MSTKEQSKSCENPCAIGKVVLFYDNFKCGLAPDACACACNGKPESSPYEYFEVPGLVKGDDAVGGIDGCPGKVCIRSTPFTNTSNTGLDRVKFLVYQKESYNAPKLGAEIVYEGIISAQQTGLEYFGRVSPVLGATAGAPWTGVNNMYEDLRLCSAGLNVLDPVSQLVFDFALTNEDIYVVYERLPLLRGEWVPANPNYDSFGQVISVGKRNIADPLNDFVKLAIAYNYRDNYVRWLVNDQEVYRLERLGFPLERETRGYQMGTAQSFPDPDALLRPTQLKYGFGTFSNMGFYNPQNPGGFNNAGLVNISATPIINSGVNFTVDPLVTNINGTLLPATYVVPSYPMVGLNVDGTNFGQGAILCIKYLTVYLLAEAKEDRQFPGLKCCKTGVLESRCCQNTVPGVNASDDLIGLKCKGKINNCDPCEIPACPCPKPVEDCTNYKPHPTPTC